MSISRLLDEIFLSQKKSRIWINFSCLKRKFYGAGSAGLALGDKPTIHGIINEVLESPCYVVYKCPVLEWTYGPNLCRYLINDSSVFDKRISQLYCLKYHYESEKGIIVNKMIYTSLSEWIPAKVPRFNITYRSSIMYWTQKGTTDYCGVFIESNQIIILLEIFKL